MLVLLESLSPGQRAVLLLHDVFDYGYPEIAVIVGKTEDNVRQLATRARRHVEQRRPRFQTTRKQRDDLARRFFAAVEHGDLAGLEALLTHDVEMTSDGGGKVPALARPLRGRSRGARLVANFIRQLARLPGASLRSVEVKGGPGALFLDGQERLIGGLALDVAGVTSQASARSSTPTSWRTWAQSPISNRYCGTGRPVCALPDDRFELTNKKVRCGCFPTVPDFVFTPHRSRLRLHHQRHRLLLIPSWPDAPPG